MLFSVESRYHRTVLRHEIWSLTMTSVAECLLIYRQSAGKQPIKAAVKFTKIICWQVMAKLTFLVFLQVSSSPNSSVGSAPCYMKNS